MKREKQMTVYRHRIRALFAPDARSLVLAPQFETAELDVLLQVVAVGDRNRMETALQDTSALPSLRVRNVRGLRVADASIMPAALNACTHAPTIMIGEKAAAMIAEDA